MSSSLRPDPTAKIHPGPSFSRPPPSIDYFDRLPDSLLLLIFNRICDVKALGRCCIVSRRFHSLIPQVENVVVKVDCVISDDDSTSSSATNPAADNRNRNGPFSNLVSLVCSGIIKHFQALGQFFTAPKRFTNPSSSGSSSFDNDDASEDQNGVVTHHSPTQVLKNFNEIRFLKIELPTGELGIEGGVLLKWRADFGSTLDNCVILGASAILENSQDVICSTTGGGIEDNGSIPESFYTDGGLKLRVVWTISSLIAASARHYLLQPIISEHKTLESLVLTDGDGQGVLCMNRDQLEELRVKPLSASSASKRTLVPALNMRLWYAPLLELPNGVVLKGATLVAIRPSEQAGVGVKKEISDGCRVSRAFEEPFSDGCRVSSAFEEPFGTAARMLVKRRTYCLEMNSF